MKRFIYFLLALGFLSSCNDEADVLPNTGQPAIISTDFSVIAEKNLQSKTSQEAYLDQQLATLNFSDNEIEKAVNYKNSFLSLSERISQLNLIGNEFLVEGNYNYALLYYLISVQLAVANDDIQKGAALYRNIALAYQHRGDYREAALNFWHSLQLWSSLGDNARIAQLHNDLGVVYALAHDFVALAHFNVENSFALAFFETALDRRIAQDASVGIQQAEYNIATLYGVWSNKVLGSNTSSDYLYAQDEHEDDL